MKKTSGDTVETKLNRALFSYRITPQATTGLSPAEMWMGRKLRCTLDFIHPNQKKKVEAKQTSQKAYHDKHARECNFGAGDPIYTKLWLWTKVDTRTESGDYRTRFLHSVAWRWKAGQTTHGSVVQQAVVRAVSGVQMWCQRRRV